MQVRLSTGGSQETVYKPAVATAAQLWRIRKRSEMAAAAAAADRRDPLELDYPCDPLYWLTEYTLVKCAAFLNSICCMSFIMKWSTLTGVSSYCVTRIHLFFHVNK